MCRPQGWPPPAARSLGLRPRSRCDRELPVGGTKDKAGPCERSPLDRNCPDLPSIPTSMPIVWLHGLLRTSAYGSEYYVTSGLTSVRLSGFRGLRHMRTMGLSTASQPRRRPHPCDGSSESAGDGDEGPAVSQPLAGAEAEATPPSKPSLRSAPESYLNSASTVLAR